MIRSAMEKGVLSLIIDRPNKKNALSPEMYVELTRQIKSAQNKESVRVILLKAQGTDFCAGNDLGDFLQLVQSGELPGVMSGELSAFPPVQLLHTLVDNKIPIVAAVQGAAIGIGLTILLHCDLVLCADNARFQTPFVDLGLVPEAASSLLLPERVGKANAAEFLLLGSVVSAHRAVQMGLCNSLCQVDELDSKAMQLAIALAQKPPNALALSKGFLSNYSEVLHQRIDEEILAFMQCLQSDEAQAAISRFFQKN